MKFDKDRIYKPAIKMDSWEHITSDSILGECKDFGGHSASLKRKFMAKKQALTFYENQSEHKI